MYEGVSLHVGSVQVVGFFDVAARLRSHNGPVSVQWALGGLVAV